MMMNIFWLLAGHAFISEICYFGSANLLGIDADAYRNVTELITSKGYPVEEHTVQTSDGYLLSVQRIPHGRIKSTTTKKRLVVFFMHGLLTDSSIFVWNYRNQSLGFVLADNGYDVWMGNSRGNTYSRKHVSLSPNSEKFWDYSLDEIIEKDLTAMIDYALDQTGQKKLSFIGHSQGNTVMFALLSESPTYNKKVNIFIALAPVGAPGYIGGLYKLLSPLGPIVQLFYKEIGLVEIFPRNLLFDSLKYICATELRYLCAEVLFLVAGRDTKELNYTRLPVYLNNIPAGQSAKSIIHLSQMVIQYKFQKYDYGKLGNIKHYNQATPPQYDVSKITAPISLMSGLNDLIANPKEVNAMKPLLKSVVSDYVVPFPKFTHGDFIWGIDAYRLLNKKVLSVLQKYS